MDLQLLSATAKELVSMSILFTVGVNKKQLGGGFKYVLFLPLLGE